MLVIRRKTLSIPKVYMIDAVENKDPNSNRAAKEYHQIIIVYPDGTEKKSLHTTGSLEKGVETYEKNTTDWEEEPGFFKRWFGWLNGAA